MPVVDLFCGCGGMSSGFQNAGFDIVAAFDHWRPAITCYNRNVDGNHASILDLSDVDTAVQAIVPFNPTVIIGGPPCQDFSNAGTRTEGERANLTYTYSEIITRIMPDYFIMENVPRARESEAYLRARQNYINAGYGLTEVILDASKCGVPQKRNRFFCIGALEAPHGFLLGNIFTHYNNGEVSVRDYFNAQGYPLEIDAYYRHPTTYARRGVYSVDRASPTIRGVNRPKPPTYNRHPNDEATEEEMIGVRHLTNRERAYIQTFPNDFILEGLDISNGNLEQMIGNAVPVLLAEFVARRLSEYIEGIFMERDTTFADWLKTSKNYTDRTIGDVFSRIRRAQEILPEQPLNRYFIADLEETQAFAELTVDIKSQMRRAIRLRIAFENEPRGDIQ